MTTGSPPTQPRLGISAGRSGSSIAQMTHANSDLVVEIWGTQSRERAVERHVDVLDKRRYEQLTFSSAGHARQFGEALIAAADETRSAGKLRSDHGLQQLVFRL